MSTPIHPPAPTGLETHDGISEPHAGTGAWFRHPAWALGSTLLWGMIELMALARSRRKTG